MSEKTFKGSNGGLKNLMGRVKHMSKRTRRAGNVMEMRRGLCL